MAFLYLRGHAKYVDHGIYRWNTFIHFLQRLKISNARSAYILKSCRFFFILVISLEFWDVSCFVDNQLRRSHFTGCLGFYCAIYVWSSSCDSSCPFYLARITDQLLILALGGMSVMVK